MANLYVLEGDNEERNGKRRNSFKVHRGNQKARMARVYVPGILEGSVTELLGRSLFSKVKSVAKSVGKVAISPVTTRISVVKSVGKATVAAVKNPSLTSISKIVTNPIVRTANETKSIVKETGHAAAETGRATNTAVTRSMDVTRRVAKRLIKGLAKKVLFKGATFLGAGSVSAIPKNAAKGVLIPVATAAVVANTVTAPAAPAVPVLVNEVIDELYSAIENKIKAGMSPDKAAAEAKAELDRLEKGEENDPKVGGGYSTLLLVGAAGILALFVLRRR